MRGDERLSDGLTILSVYIHDPEEGCTDVSHYVVLDNVRVDKHGLDRSQVYHSGGFLHAGDFSALIKTHETCQTFGQSESNAFLSLDDYLLYESVVFNPDEFVVRNRRVYPADQILGRGVIPFRDFVNVNLIPFPTEQNM